MEDFPKELSSSLHILGFTFESSWTFRKPHTWSMCLSLTQHNCLLWVVFCYHIQSFYYGTLKEIILWNLLLFLSQDIVRTLFTFFFWPLTLVGNSCSQRIKYASPPMGRTSLLTLATKELGSKLTTSNCKGPYSLCICLLTSFLLATFILFLIYVFHGPCFFILLLSYNLCTIKFMHFKCII